MDACYWIKVPHYQWKLQREKKTSSSIQWCKNFDLNCRKTEKSSQTKLATSACSDWIFFAFDNFPPCIPQCNTEFFHRIGRLWLVNLRQFHLARAVRAAFTEHVMPFSSLVSHMTWWGDRRTPCWFRLNILKLIRKWQGGSSSFGEIYRYVFVRFMSLCKSVYMFYTRTGRTACVCVERASVTRQVCLCACLRVFVG